MRRPRISLTLAQKLSLMLLCIILIPTFIVEIAMYRRYQAETDALVERYLEKSYELHYNIAEECLYEMKAQAGYLANLPELRSIPSHPYGGVDRTLVRDASEMSGLFTSANNLFRLIASEYTYLLDDGRVFGTWGTLQFDADISWLKKIMLQPAVRGYIWTGLNVEGANGGVSNLAPSLAVLRSVSGDIGATLITSFSTSAFFKRLGAMDGGTALLLYDAQKQALVASTPNVPETLLEYATDAVAQTGYTGVSQYNRQGYYFISKRLTANNWYLLQVIDESLPHGTIAGQLKGTVWMLALFFIGMVTLTFLMVFRTMAGLRRLDDAIHSFESGASVGPLRVSGQDEIATVTAHFNQMLIRIDTLLLKTQQDEQEKMRLHFEALSAQITPHFLYNTLNSIKWVAMFSKAPNVADLISSLGALLEASTSKSNETILFEEELINLKHYMNLQYARFGEGVLIQYDIEDAAMRQMVPKFMLQPFVENALIHGFERRLRYGRIDIRAVIADGTFHASVADDGRGVPEERLSDLRAALNGDAQQTRSTGMSNVHRRIQFLFGKAYGIELQSREGSGFTAIIRLPVRLDEREGAANV